MKDPLNAVDRNAPRVVHRLHNIHSDRTWCGRLRRCTQFCSLDAIDGLLPTCLRCYVDKWVNW